MVTYCLCTPVKAEIRNRYNYVSYFLYLVSYSYFVIFSVRRVRNQNINIQNTLTRCLPCIVFIVLIVEGGETLGLNVVRICSNFGWIEVDPILLLLFY